MPTETISREHSPGPQQAQLKAMGHGMMDATSREAVCSKSIQYKHKNNDYQPNGRAIQSNTATRSTMELHKFDYLIQCIIEFIKYSRG